ncbi:MAG: tetratricopeptide repeat protein [Ignavibacteria bacterium]|nr:tetratricopeptide repeat protein [Ignavibacteria bacterium]
MPYLLVFIFSAKSKYIKAVEAFKNGDYDNAAAILEKIKPSSSMYFYSRLFLSSMEVKQKRTDNAIQICRELIRNHPDRFEPYQFLSQIYLTLKANELSLDYMYQALERNPPRKDKYALYVNMGTAFDSLGEYEKAIQYYLNAIEQIGNDYLVYNNIGYAYLLQSKFSEAISYLDKSIYLNSKFAFSYNNRGFAFANLGDFEKAFEDFKTSLLLDPSNPYLYKFRGLSYYKSRNYSEAKINLEKALQLDPKFANEISPILSEISKIQ